MLIQHFKLGVEPFGVTPDARFLYLSPTHREALASLFYGIQAGRGFTALIAAPGMGKTTLLFHLLGLLMENSRSAFLFQTLCGPEEFLRSLLADLGIDDEGGDPIRMHAKLNAYLLEESKNGRQVVVVIDEAQNLDVRVLELVRMLSNFETPGKKLMHLVLSGQPQLAERLASEELTQLRQRVSIVARLAPLNADETREYIEHRLRTAGASGDKPIFTKEAYTLIAAQSGGIPRNINNLCFNAMSLACALNQGQVDASMVREAINDLDLTTIPNPKASSTDGASFGTVLTSPNLMPTLTAAWRYRWVAAIALLICVVGLLAHFAVPSNNQVLAQPAAIGASQGTGTDADPAPAVDARSLEQPLQETNAKAASGPPNASTSVLRHKGHSRANRHSADKYKKGKTNFASGAIAQPVVGSPSRVQGVEKPSPVGDRTTVPLEPEPQREKR